MKEKNKKKNGESSAKPRRIVAILCVLLALSVILDYFNISQVFHIDMSNFNWDFLSIFVGNLVVVGLYYLTYWLIDRHNIKRTENQERNVKTVINEVYKQCNKIIALLENEIGIVEVLPDVQPDNNTYVADVIETINKSVFATEPFIYDAVVNGIIAQSELETYINIRSDFIQYVSYRARLFANKSKGGESTKTSLLVDTIKDLKTKLMHDIEQQLSKAKQ